MEWKEGRNTSDGPTTNRMGNRNTLRDKFRPDWPPDSIAHFISDMTLINTVPH